MLSSAESPKVLCRPFLTRVLFHLLMLTLWPMFSVVVLSSLNINAVFAVANFLIPCFLLYMDYLTVQRRVPSWMFYLLDFVLSTGTCILAVLVNTLEDSATPSDQSTLDYYAQNNWQAMVFNDSNLDIVGYIGMDVPVFLAILYDSFLVIHLFFNWAQHGRPFSPFFAAHFPDADLENEKRSWTDCFFGRERSKSEQDIVSRRCSSVVFGYTIFRKHPFEPVILALIRGVLACWATLGIAAYAALLIFTAVRNPTTTVTRSLAKASVASAPSDIVIASDVNGAIDNLTITSWTSSSPCPFQTTSHNCSVITILDGATSTRISLSTASPISVWMLGGLAGHGLPDWMKQISAAFAYSEPFILQPNSHFIYQVSPILQTQGSTTWLAYDPLLVGLYGSETYDPDTLSFNYSYHQRDDARWIPEDTFNTPSVFITVLGIISAVGGAFVATSGIFVIIFGRGVWAVLSGARPISPFGILGRFQWFRKSIHRHYPLLREECDQGGMASFIEEVAMDIGIVRRESARLSLSHEALAVEGGLERDLDEAELLPRPRSRVAPNSVGYTPESGVNDAERTAVS